MYAHNLLCFVTQQFIGTPKSRGSTKWFSFIMSHHEKNAEIHKIFSSLTVEEKLIDGELSNPIYFVIYFNTSLSPSLSHQTTRVPYKEIFSFTAECTSLRSASVSTPTSSLGKPLYAVCLHSLSLRKCSKQNLIIVSIF